MNLLLEFVKEQDPTAIIYVLGDHGPKLSKRIKYEENEEFYVQDRYGVYGGFYPADRCQDSFSKPYSKDYVTAIQGMHMIIRCLSGGDEAYINPDDSSLEGYHTKGAYEYANYLYE